MRLLGEEGLSVRPLMPGDSEGLFALFSEREFLHHASTRERFELRDEMQRWLDGIMAAQRYEIVALLHEEIVGYGGLYVLGDGQDHAGFVMLGVRHTFRRRGIGSILMHMLVATATHYVGLRRVQLTVFTENAAAIRLYRKFGFEIEGLHRFFARRGTEFVHALTMARVVDDPDAAALAPLPSMPFGAGADRRKMFVVLE